MRRGLEGHTNEASVSAPSSLVGSIGHRSHPLRSVTRTWRGLKGGGWAKSRSRRGSWDSPHQSAWRRRRATRPRRASSGTSADAGQLDLGRAVGIAGV
jgi:hypothetical protein